MARIEMLKSLVNERLTAAAEEIFGVFERTITEYEEEIDRQRKLLHLALKPDVKRTLGRPDATQLFICEEEVAKPQEQQEWSPSQGREEPKPPVEGQEQPDPLLSEAEPVDLWVSQDGDQVDGLEEADVIKFTFHPVPVKRELDEDKPQSSWLSQPPTALPGTSAEMVKTEPDEEFCDTSDPACNLDSVSDAEPTSDGHMLLSDYSDSDTEDVEEWKEAKDLQLGPNALDSKTHSAEEQSLSVIKFKRSVELFHELQSSDQSSPCCQVCGKSYPNKKSLMSHVKVHPSDCGLCGKRLEPAESLKIHFQAHSTCNFCSKRFTSIAALERHVKTHTGEKPFSCSVCSETFRQKGYLKIHMRIHTGERPFSCSVCGKGFGQKGHLSRHWRSHMGEKT